MFNRCPERLKKADLVAHTRGPSDVFEASFGLLRYLQQVNKKQGSIFGVHKYNFGVCKYNSGVHKYDF